MSSPKPELVTDVPCPKVECNARVGEACWKDPPYTDPRRRTEPHAARTHRLATARVDWDRLQEWRRSVDADSQSQTAGLEREAAS